MNRFGPARALRILGALPAPSFFVPLADSGSGAINLTAIGLGSTTPTFTRAATATTISSTGLVIPVGTGVARSYYDPTTLQYMGYLPEGQRTNLLLWSEDFSNAAWSKTDTTITADSTTAPDGLTTADLATEGVTGTQNVAQNVTATADVNYTASVWVKRGNHDWFSVTLLNGANVLRGFFNLGLGTAGTNTVSGTAVSVGATIKAYPNGWYRCTVTGSVGSGATTISTVLRSATADGNAAQVPNATHYLWGAQFENNTSLASSYIPTTNAAVTRNADVLKYPFAGNADATQGTAYAELGTEWPSNFGGVFVAIGMANATNIGPLHNAGSATTIRSSDGTTAVTKGGLSDMSVGCRKRAASYGPAGQAITGDGLAPATDIFDGSMTGDAIGIGNNASGTQSWFGTIKNVMIWNAQLSNQQLQSLTG